MAGGYAGSIQDFTNSQQKVTNVRTDVDSTLKSLYGQLQELEGQWVGTAKQSFDALLVRFNDDAKKLTDALQGIADQLGAAGGTYQAQEEEHSSSFSNITGTLG